MKFLLSYPIRIVYALFITALTLGWSLLMFLWHLWEIPYVYNPFKADFWEFFEEESWGYGTVHKSVWHWCFGIA